SRRKLMLTSYSFYSFLSIASGRHCPATQLASRGVATSDFREVNLAAGAGGRRCDSCFHICKGYNLMPGHLEGRVAIVTGAGRGLGRSYAMALAAQGAAVVVNDLGGDLQGNGRDATPAQETVAEIRANGGRAIVSGHDVADWRDAEEMVALAIDHFGGLDILVNNAGILR